MASIIVAAISSLRAWYARQSGFFWWASSSQEI